MAKTDQNFKTINFYCGAAGEQELDEIGENEKRKLAIHLTDRGMKAAGFKKKAEGAGDLREEKQK